MGSDARTMRKVVCYLAPILGFLTAAGVLDGSAGFLVAGALAVVATPIVAFALNQVSLTDKGRQLATTVAEVQSLKEADSAAFARMFNLRDDDVEPRCWPYAPEATRYYPSRAELALSSSVSRRSGLSSFWTSLTDGERAWLSTRARNERLPAGAVLCRQDNPAWRVFIIISGQAVVLAEEGGVRRCVAVRGAGDIVGERGAIEVRPRSATVMAIVPVAVLVTTSSDFAAFLQCHPRVLTVLQYHVYDHLAEDCPMRPASNLSGIISRQPRWSGLNCSIFLADIAAFGGNHRNDNDRQFLRGLMYRILERAFEESGVPWRGCYREDRGDGVLVIVPPGTPTRFLIYPLANGLAGALAAHNSRASEALRMQLRVALNVGPVVCDPEGVSGESIILAARILEAPVLKRGLALGAADLGLIVSAYVYENVVRHASERIDSTHYQRVRVRVKESQLDAWMYLLGGVNSTLNNAPAVK